MTLRNLLIFVGVSYLVSCQEKSKTNMHNYMYATELINNDENVKALEALNKIIETNPDYPQDAITYELRGQARLNLADTIGACNDWQKAKLLYHTPSKKVNKLLKQYCN